MTEIMTNDWIEWAGGECPVEGSVLVDTRFRRGNVIERLEAGFWYWSHASNRRDKPSDIIAYRVVSAGLKEPGGGE